MNKDGERFMTRYEPAAELASRDLVSRAIVREQHRTGGPVYLSMAQHDPEWTRARFPDDRAKRVARWDSISAPIAFPSDLPRIT